MERAHSVVGTNLLSYNLDPLQLVGEGLVICLDDMERISPRVTLEEVLGLTTYLAENKNCKVLLIMNEDALVQKGENYAGTMQTYRERVVSNYLRIETDLEGSYSLLLQGLPESSAACAFLANSQQHVLRPFVVAGHSNLRTLRRVIDAIDEIIESGVSLEPQLITSLAAFFIEHDTGSLREIDFYSFNEMVTLMTAAMKRNSGQPAPDDMNQERLSFHKKYWGGAEGYRFVKAFYDRVQYGYFDLPALKEELSPNEERQDPLTVAIAATQARKWWYLSDEEYEEWVRTVEKIIESDREMKTVEIIYSLLYLTLATENSSAQLAPDTLSRIKERLNANALRGDETFTHDQRMSLSQRQDIWAPYIDGYDVEARKAVIENLVSSMVKVVEEEDLDELVKQVVQKSKGLLAAVADQSLKALAEKAFTNRQFFNDAISLLVEEFNNYRGTSYIPNVDQHLRNISDVLKRLRSDPKAGKADQLRIDKLLNKLP